MIDSKNITIEQFQIIKLGSMYRYISHDLNMITNGCLDVNDLLKYREVIRFDSESVPYMLDRYDDYFDPSLTA